MTDSPPILADLDGPGDPAALLAELATLDEVGRRRRVHEVIRWLGGCTAAVQQECRDAIIGAGYIGARDWNAALSEAKKAAKAHTKRTEQKPLETRYKVVNAQLHIVDDFGGLVPLAQFVPRVVSQIHRDDGAEQTLLVRIRITLPSGQHSEVEVPGDRLSKARHWSAAAVGAAAVIHPMSRDESHVATAAQILGKEAGYDTLTQYAHTGWRVIDGSHRFLTASGAIGADGLDPSICVDLGNARLNNYALPNPAGVPIEELRAAVRASLDVRYLAPLTVTAPMMAATYRAPLPILPESSVFVVGQSGSLKTALTAVLAQHYGAAMDAKHLPGDWKSTGNALEVMAHALAYVLFPIDDYAPQGVEDPRKLAASADRVLRGVANTSGRDRLRPDGTPRPAKPPRAQCLATGEDIPPGQSLRARLTIVEIERGQVDTGRLTEAQKLATDGTYALAMAGYLRYLAGRQDEDQGFAAGLRAIMTDLRTAGQAEGRHLRTPEATAGLLTGWTLWLRYAVAIKAVTTVEAEGILAEVTEAMYAVADRQSAHSQGMGAAEVYLAALTTAVTGGGAHFADQAGGDLPTYGNPAVWGWEAVTVGTAENEQLRWRARGTCVGWVSRDRQVYLDPGSAHQVAVTHAARSNVPLATTAVTVSRRLREGGYLATFGKTDIQVVRRVVGRSRKVLHVRSELFGPTEDEGE